MSDTSDINNNSDQIEFWNGETGEQWALNQEDMDGFLKPFSEALVSSAAPRVSEMVLDIGCGCGDTTLMFAERVGPEGKATGLDISEPMVARARERAKEAAEAGKPAPDFIVDDASKYNFDGSGFDLVTSRFGVMFFANPAPAFANIRTALKPGGRMSFICWQPLTENPFFMVPTMAVLTVLPPPEPAEPNAPGPFAFGDRDHTFNILEEAGFTDISIDSLELDITLNENRSVEEAAMQTIKSGPASRLTADASEDEMARILEAVTKALAEHEKDGLVELATRTWLVSARNS